MLHGYPKDVRHRTLANLDYAELADAVRTSGGFTVALDGRRPTSGYAVSLPSHTRRFRHGVSPADIYRYVIVHGRALRDDGAYLGAWTDADGAVSLDVSHVFTDRRNALTLGAMNGQTAIYDLGAGCDVQVAAPDRVTP